MNATDEAIVREIRGILNKLTLDKFDALSDKILSMDIMSSSETLKGVINCVFDKAVDEPHFCPMYAQLCVKIVHAEAQERKKAQLAKGLPAPDKPHSEFRSLLVTRCQTEYLNKRAWSKKRLEKLFEKNIRDGTTLEMDKSKRPEDIGHLTEEDLSLIKTKRHVLGNVHLSGSSSRRAYCPTESCTTVYRNSWQTLRILKRRNRIPVSSAKDSGEDD